MKAKDSPFAGDFDPPFPKENMDKENEEKIWYYEEKGARKGPVSEEKIRQLIDSKVVFYDTSVWKQGFSDWRRVSETELRGHLDSVGPPPLLGEKVNNTFVWILAFAPILGTFLEGVIAGFVHGSRAPLHVHEYWHVTLILNLLLCVLDELQLKKAGHNTARFRGWIWLIPVYIFQRANALRQSKAYFVVWVISFAVIVLRIL